MIFTVMLVIRNLILATLFLGFFTGVSPAAGSLDPETTLNKERIKPRGQWYEVITPDTLDLVDRAELSINALIGNMDPERYYGVYQGFRLNSNPPQPHALTWNITPKNARTLPMLRAMTGSEFGIDAEFNMMRALLSQIHEDGLMYYPFDGSGPPKGTSYPQSNALMIFAMLNWSARDENPRWLEWMDLLAKGLRNTAIQVEDRAYYPMQSGIRPDGTWHFMLGSENLPIPYTPPDEPSSDQQGLEGAPKSDQARHLSALVQHYRLSENRASLELAKKISRFILKPGMWEDTGQGRYPGNEHGIFEGHFHNNTEALMSLLDLALATNDDWLKQFVREGYAHARRIGILRMGWFPAWTMPERYNRPAWLHGITEPCGVGDMAVLAVKLTDAGLGEYWDDVDYIVRNHLSAQQIIDLEGMRKIAGGSVQHDSLLRRFRGGFAAGNPTAIQNYDIAGCCTVNGAQGFYYAWHGITRFSGGVAQVNLFLNRVSPWMDIKSYLPYEGKVILHNRSAHTALVRIPAWVESERLKSFLNGELVRPHRAGSYLVFQELKMKDEIRLEFPVARRTDRYTIDGKSYLVSFQGSTVVDIEPRDSEHTSYPLYQVESFESSPAQHKTFCGRKTDSVGSLLDHSLRVTNPAAKNNTSEGATKCLIRAKISSRRRHSVFPATTLSSPIVFFPRSAFGMWRYRLSPSRCRPAMGWLASLRN